jgi:hypothetical protein
MLARVVRTPSHRKADTGQFDGLLLGTTIGAGSVARKHRPAYQVFK